MRACVCVCVFSPDISIALFLKVLMTVPSFLRRRGELRLSATFCFSRDRTFRFGSETGGESAERGKMNGRGGGTQKVRPSHERNNNSSTAQTD